MKNMNRNSMNKMWSKIITKVADNTLNNMDKFNCECVGRYVDEPVLPKELLNMKIIESKKLDVRLKR